MRQPLKSTRGRKLILAGVSALALSIGGGSALVPFDQFVGMAAAETSQPMSNADIVAMDKPAVVTVLTEFRAEAAPAQSGPQGMPPEEFFRRFFGENGPFPGLPGMPGQPPEGGGGPTGHALGSGFIISSDGHIVTNNHVVDNATKITVKLDDGTELDATLVGRDAKNDIAVLKVKADHDLPVLQWGDSDKLRAGDPILAIGDPFGIGTTVTSGIVSARGRDLHSGPYDDFIQIDAPINHGNSGGPLVNDEGKVVGINTAIYSPNGGSVGVGFAIPAAQAEKVVEDIIAHGTIEHGFIGVTIQPVDAQVASALGLGAAQGALIATVQDGSPAATAELKPGDVILAVNGQDVSDPRALSRAIADLAPGDKAELVLWRNGSKETVQITVGRLGNDETASVATPENGGGVVADLGLSIETLTVDVAGNLGLPPDTSGVVVTAVDPNGPAGAVGLQEGDVIAAVNQIPVAQPQDVESAITKAKTEGRSAALLLVLRGSDRFFVAVPFQQS